MQLKDLPNDILCMVLNAALPGGDTYSRTFRSRLPLLSICRKWRQIMLPYVYYNGFVQYCSKRLHRTIDSDGNRPIDGSPAFVKIVTNLDLIAANHCTGCVTRMIVVVYYMSTPLPGLRAAVKVMRTAAKVWGGPQILEIRTNKCDLSRQPSPNEVYHGDDTSDVIDDLRDMLPAVRELQIYDTPSPRNPSVADGRLVGHYSEQLEVLVCQNTIVVPQTYTFKRLKRLTIVDDPDGVSQLPRVCPETLEVLDLCGGSASRWWTAFNTNSSNQEINFPKLRAIFLTFVKGDDKRTDDLDDSDWVLRFPALKSLILTSVGDNCPTLKYAVFPAHMGSLGITATPATFRSIASVKLPSVLHLKLCVISATSSDSGVLTVIDTLLASAGKCDTVELNIKVPNMMTQPERITYTGLTRLLIDAPVSVDAMLALITRLPRLDALTLYDLALDDIQADLSIPGSRAYRLATPLDTKLRKLAINFLRERYPPDLATPVAKYLMLSIPTLTIFAAPQTPKLPILAFMNEYYKQYPHLASLTLKIFAEGATIRYGV